MSDKPTISKLRRDIDRGHAGSKADAPDPAAAPLGTDDEAAGTRLSETEIATAQRQEIVQTPVGTAMNKTGSSGIVYIAIIFLFGAMIIAAGIFL